MVRIKPIGKGFLNLIESVFWHLHIASTKLAQAPGPCTGMHCVRGPRTKNYKTITDDHQMDLAWEQLAAASLLDGKSGWLLGTRRRWRQQRLLLEELRLLLYQPHSGSLRSMSCAIRFSNQS